MGHMAVRKVEVLVPLICVLVARFGTWQLQMVKDAYKPCVESGCIDDITQSFPTTSCGTEWTGFTDTVMGGTSQASLARELFMGRNANVLRGHVSLANGGGFIQMACYLQSHLEPIDASQFDGMEVDVACQMDEPGVESEFFNIQ
jgi:hypothetical protein